MTSITQKKAPIAAVLSTNFVEWAKAQGFDYEKLRALQTEWKKEHVAHQYSYSRVPTERLTVLLAKYEKSVMTIRAELARRS